MKQIATILVVDDIEMNRDALSRRLQRAGYETLTAEDGYQALGVVSQQPIDLVLLDIMMPGITGIDVLKVVRQNHSPADLPIIMATAKDQNEDMIEAFGLGANDYATKPINFPVLLARIEAQLRMKRAAPVAEKRPLTPDQANAEVRPGMVLGERYRLEGPIGAGGFGTVYQAQHLGLQHPVAVKILQAELARTPDALARFQREGIAACRVQHPNAVSIFDFDVTPGGVAYLVMERLLGQSLKEALEEHRRFSPQRCADILLPVCDALAVAHDDGIIHRDLKPANIFLSETRHGEVVKVLDFGIAKLVGEHMDENLTAQDALLGTSDYMAPERINNGEIDGRSDVYSLGVMLFAMLTGERPFFKEGNTALDVIMSHLNETPPLPSSLNPDIPPKVEAVVMDALRKRRSERPFVEQFAAALQAALG